MGPHPLAVSPFLSTRTSPWSPSLIFVGREKRENDHTTTRGVRNFKTLFLILLIGLTERWDLRES